MARRFKGASQAPWRLPALHPLVRGEKENRDNGPARAPEFKARDDEVRPLRCLTIESAMKGTLATRAVSPAGLTRGSMQSRNKHCYDRSALHPLMDCRVTPLRGSPAMTTERAAREKRQAF